MDVGKFQKQWSDDVIEELCRRHRAGESIRKLSAESGIPRETLRRRFKQARLAADHATRAHRQQRSKPDPNRPETLPAQPLPYEEQAKLDEAAREAKSRAFAAANDAHRPTPSLARRVRSLPRPQGRGEGGTHPRQR